MPIVKNRELPDILQAMKDLAAERIPMGGAMRLCKMYRALRAHWEDVNEVRMNLLRQYARCDERGRPLQDGRGNAIWKGPQDQAEADAAFEELMDGAFEHPYILHPKRHLGYDPAKEKDEDDPQNKRTIMAALLIGLGPFLGDEDEGATE